MKSDRLPSVVGIITFLVLGLCARGALGDTVELKDGTTVTGTYAGGSADRIRLDTPDGVREIDRSDAVSLKFAAPPPRQAAAQVPPAAKLANNAIPAGSLLVVRMQN